MLAKKRRLWSTPEIKEQRLIFWVLRGVIDIIPADAANALLDKIEQHLATSAKKLLKVSFGIGRDKSMNIENVVKYAIGSTLGEKVGKQSFQFTVVSKLIFQIINNFLLFGSELAWVVKIEGRKVGVIETADIIGFQHLGKPVEPEP